MSRDSSISRSKDVNAQLWIIASLLAATVLVSAMWWWSGWKVELNRNEYDVALALYRVCNQHSEAELAKIEQEWKKTSAAAGVESRKSRFAIAEIFDDAKAGNWRDASMHCRKVLDDQVKH